MADPRRRQQGDPAHLRRQLRALFPAQARSGHGHLQIRLRQRHRKSADVRALLNATDPNLGPFRRRGGKLLMYFGWADTALPPLMGIDYYMKAVAANGLGTPDFFRLFMVPGMFHCRGGVGPDRLDAMTAL